MKKIIYFILITLVASVSCSDSRDIKNNSSDKILADYLEYSGMDDELSGGVKLISVSTPKGNFNVWTRRVGNNPRIKVLLLHGGPGFTHEYLECFESYFPKAGIEYYYYDQLG